MPEEPAGTTYVIYNVGATVKRDRGTVTPAPHIRTNVRSSNVWIGNIVLAPMFVPKLEVFRLVSVFDDTSKGCVPMLAIPTIHWTWTVTHASVFG
ncbi:hypothetical protein NQ317_006472 [Molorchus minor]|uniref:Uncharacterized protein n=1 Tax=Molorchus minor TaxID=1323400 RepID=A0ABQ9J645_9CUCU|nr:hypothetical protein NQ317_006472 [Molorchus minor]